MSIENPHFQPLPAEDEPGEQLTPERLIEYVRKEEALPTLDQSELQRLNDSMTQEEIIELHTTLNELDNRQRRQELLDQWIPRPKILYHRSRSGDVKTFQPRDVYKRHPDDPPLVYGGTSEAVAAMMLAPGGDSLSRSGSWDSHRTWTLIYPDTEEFRQADTGGYIYELPPDGFECDPNLGLGLAEWTSTKPVKPLGKPKHYATSIEAMLEHGVKVYPVDQATFNRFRAGNEDEVELLKTLTPLESSQ